MTQDKFKTEMAHKLIQQKEKMSKDKSSFENVWQQISEFVLPNRGDFTTQRSQGARLDQRVFDTTAVQANEMLAAALYSGLTNPQTTWFNLRIGENQGVKSAATDKWLAEVTRIMLEKFDDTDSGFYQQNHEFLLDLVAYGTSCMYVDESIGDGLRFSTRHLSEISILENSMGIIDTVSRSFKFTARQAAQEWGEENLSMQLRSAIGVDPHRKFDFIHLVMPKADAVRLDSSISQEIQENREFVGFYICEEDKAVINVAGFYENPYLVTRWAKLVSETYGRSPAWNALSDIRMINVMSEVTIRAAQKQVDPPLLVADDGVIMPLRTRPSGINVGGVSADGRPLIQPLATGGNLNVGLEMMQQRRDAIRQAYFVDQFVPKQGTPVSATEAAQNQDNSLRLTGPQLSRIQNEYLGQLINRTFSILQRAGEFPDPPPELENIDLTIVYTSPLAKNQRSKELFALNRALQSSQVLLDTNPTLLDIIDGDIFLRDALEISGVSALTIRSEDDVKVIRSDRQKQLDEQQGKQELTEGADTVAKLKSAGVEI